jgi:hypothetical protein
MNFFTASYNGTALADIARFIASSVAIPEYMPGLVMRSR